MLNRMFGLPDEPWVILITLISAGYTFFLLLAGLSYWFFFVWKKERFHPDYRPDKKEIRRSLSWSLYSIVGNALLMLPLHIAIAKGYSKVYFHVEEHGWWWVLISAALILAITETMIYWIHRALHIPVLFRWLHKPHHSFRVATPWAGVAFHPLDSFLQALPHHLCVFLFPVHVGVYTAFITAITIWAVLIHDRLSFMPWRGVNYTGHHTVHHWYYRYNYGQFFTFWDRIGGTYKDPETLYRKIPPTVLRPHQWPSRSASIPAPPKAGEAVSPSA